MQILVRALRGGRRWIARIRSRASLIGSGCVALGHVEVAAHVRLRATDGGQAWFGNNVTIDRFADITVKQGRLDIGPGTYVGQFSVICARQAVTIGADCLIAEHVTIRDQDHRFARDAVTARSGFITAPVRIGNNVWLGAKVTVLKGVTIGSNVVVGANSVVNGDLPDNVVAVGVPARVIREL